MSDTESRKSMDDVLASIRRIVRAEKEPDAEPAGGDYGERRQESRPEAGHGGESGDEPLALTPDMRIDSGPVGPEAISHPAENPIAVAPAGNTRAAAIPAGATGPGALSDREALRRLVRQILIEELTEGSAEGAIRDLIRDELMNGEIGNNISQNVQRLIQAEVASALNER